MKCINCGGEIRFTEGVAFCTVCNSKYSIDHVFENIDVNLCYIENDSMGRRTRDSIIAQEVYQKLEAKGLRTFYERISAATIYGEDLEQVRYKSIYDAKIILVLGTSVEHFNTILETYGEYFSDKTVVPFCCGVNPSDIPRQLSKIQAIDYATIGWEKDLEKGLLRLLGRETEVDLLSANGRAKKKCGIFVGIAVLCALVIVGICGLRYLRPTADPDVEMGVSTSSDNVEPSSDQQIYEDAQKLIDSGKFLEAASLYSEILNYEDSQDRLKDIFDRYDGYYSTADKKFQIELNFKNAAELSIEMTEVSENGVAKATASSYWNGTQNTYTFTDNMQNSGEVSVTLNDDAIAVSIQSANANSTVSVWNQEVTFLLSEKSDSPEVLQVSKELLLSWVKTPTTVEEIAALGFELEVTNAMIGVGGGVLPNACIYTITGADVQLFVAQKNSDEKEYFALDFSEQAPQIICAISARAEDIIPEKLNTAMKPFVENDFLYAPGGNGIYLGMEGFSFGTDQNSYEPSGNIAADTRVGVISKALAGTGSFVKTVAWHVSRVNIAEFHGTLVEETETHYVFAKTYNGVDFIYTYKVDKKTYETEWFLD